MKTAKELLGFSKYEYYKKLNMLPMYDLGRAAYIDRDELVIEMKQACAYRIADRKSKTKNGYRELKFHKEYERILNLSLREISMEMIAEMEVDRK